jgi:hypothetical protein
MLSCVIAAHYSFTLLCSHKGITFFSGFLLYITLEFHMHNIMIILFICCCTPVLGFDLLPSIFPWKLDFELITFKLNPDLQSGVLPPVIIVTGAMVVMGWWCVVVEWQLWMWVWLRCFGIQPGPSDWAVYLTSNIPDRICPRLVYLYDTGHQRNLTVKTLKYFWHEFNQNHFIKVKIFCNLKPSNIVLDFILQL